MTTVRDICTRALRKIGVVPQGDEPDGEQLLEAIEAYNMMVHAWKVEGFDLNHVTLAASDAFSLGAEYEEGCVYILASRMSPDYEVPQAFNPDEWFRSIQAANHTIVKATMPRALTRLPSRYWRDTRIR